MSNLSVSDNSTLAQHEIEDIWHNINRSSSDRITYWISIASFIFAIFGSISNLMSVIILRRLSAQLSTFVYLTGLSLSDMITCISIVMTYMIEFIVGTRRNTSITIFLRYVEIIFGGLAAGSRALSLWISTAVTMDRWVLICYPMYGKTFCTLNRAKFISRTLFIIAFLYSIPLFFEYEIVQMPHVYQTIDFDNESFSLFDENIQSKSILVAKGYSDLAKRRIYRWAYMFFNAVFVYILSTLTIVFFNLQLIRALHRVKSRTKLLKKHHKNGKHHNRHQRSFQAKYSVTIIVIVLVLTLLICRSPTIVIWILWSFELTIKAFFDSSSSALVRRFHNIANLIAIINAATNFLPFYVFGQLFRTECLNIYCCRKVTNEQILPPTRQKSDENFQCTINNEKIKKHDKIQQRKLIQNDNLQNTFPLSSETTSSPMHSASVNSSTHVIRLCDSPFHFPNYGQHIPKISSVTTSLVKETTDL
ncbi:unnamed protein product [Rotaria sp. Silwood2]|nr:unnamed protein product [Rotaria sp. Silwood2]CAF2749490.1 unnamed protein product [Rotaria sp. Silwood2]CAF2991673.1 unnamed protein product [Rotaria sp. Silwood2]CAF3163930.1 unnamed protein product [Rotaria sp. Silwood2]CAF3915346.1 unnamed protein product [Rotaria sp. Silwood2]